MSMSSEPMNTRGGGAARSIGRAVLLSSTVGSVLIAMGCAASSGTPPSEGESRTAAGQQHSAVTKFDVSPETAKALGAVAWEVHVDHLSHSFTAAAVGPHGHVVGWF